jgi:hypothetical protein
MNDAEDEDSRPLPPDAGTARTLSGGDLPMLYCPVCSSRLDQRSCKLICARCGYYMSCADYV